MPYDNLRKFMKNPQPESYAPKGMDDLMLRTLGDPTEGLNPLRISGNLLEEFDSVTGKPLRAGTQAAVEGNNPLSAIKEYFGAGPDKDVSGREVAHSILSRTEGAGMPLRPPGANDYAVEAPLGHAIDFLSQLPGIEAIKGATKLGKAAIEAAPSILGNEIGSIGKSIKPNKLGLFSKLEDVLNRRMGDVATPQEIEGIIKEVKPEEIEYSKIRELLSGKKKVSKEEVLDHVRKNTPQIEERILFNDNKYDPGKIADEIQDLVLEKERLGAMRIPDPNGDLFFNEVFEDKAMADRYAQVVAREKELRALFDEALTSKPKYQDFTTPGGENYKEMLLKLSTQKQPADLNSYYSRHWPGDRDVLAHYRTKDFTGPEGEKILLAEEAQSDWHQAGRKKGYKKPIDTDAVNNKLVELESKKLELRSKIDADSMENGTDPIKHPLNSELEKVNEEYKTLQESLPIGGDIVPDAPFKKTWQELVMKRLLNRAAEEGYDKLAWVPGMQQAERYGLDKARKLKIIKNEAGTYDIEGIPIGLDEYQSYAESIPAEKLESYIGKDLFDKIDPKLETNVFEGDALKINPKGMKGFYDKILVDYMNNFAKKFGQRVEKTPLRAKDFTVEPVNVLVPRYLDLKNQLGELEKMGTYSPEAGDFTFPTKELKSKYNELVKEHLRYVDNPRLTFTQDGFEVFDKKTGQLHRGFKTEEEAAKWIEDQANVHSVKLTPEMIEAIKAGLPLFALGGVAIAPEAQDKYFNLKKLMGK